MNREICENCGYDKDPVDACHHCGHSSVTESGEKARSSDLLARREADEGLGDNETGKASSDVSPHRRCLNCGSTWIARVCPDTYYCLDCKSAGQRREERAERRANNMLSTEE